MDDGALLQLITPSNDDLGSPQTIPATWADSLRSQTTDRYSCGHQQRRERAAHALERGLKMKQNSSLSLAAAG